MKLLISFFYIIYILHANNAQNSLVEEYVNNITELQKQSQSWIYPQNSYSYLGKKFKFKKHIYDGEFDFIICGAGSAGTVIANRLSEINKWKILVLEAGTWENNMTDIPGMASALRTTNYNWGYLSSSQKNGLKGYINNSIYMPRGKAVGGSSVLNSMIYARGCKDDYDQWGKNNPGWNYEEVLPYFKKSEKASFTNANSKYHGTTGELNVEYSSIVNDLGQAFLNANEELNHKILDYNAESEIGFSVLELNEINGRRDSGGKSFINPIKYRKNLHIYTNTLITKLMINNEHKKAYGVQYLRNGVLHYALASKEVILAAGAINTPQILMLSGIGPREHLDNMKISVVQDLPVGNNLWDHLSYSAQAFKINYPYANIELKQQVEDYLKGTGLLTSAYNLQIIGFASIYDAASEQPDIEYLFNSYKIPIGTYENYHKSVRFTEETFNNIVKPTEGLDQWTVSVVLLHPKSRGTVRLKSSSPLEFPVIDPNYFSDPSDAKTFSTAISDLKLFANTQALKKYNSTMIKVCHPACDCSEWGTDNFWRCMATNLANSVYHFSGTAKMGNKNDKTSVVGHLLKVHGIRNLRIADASVIPVTISGHTNAAAYMIGEKASELIKKEHCDGIMY